MILIRFLEKFLLPSVFIPVLILVGLYFLAKSERPEAGRILIFIGIILWYIFSITPLADLILWPLESRYNQVGEDRLGAADKVVLLLGGRESNVSRTSEVLRIYNQQLKIIISGTDPLNPERDAAAKVKEFLVERGIAAENIILEDKSRYTLESAKIVKGLVGQEPFFLVTSAYHLPRAVELFQKVGTNPIPAPADFKREREYNILDFFPDIQNLEKSDLAFSEYFRILFHKIF